jgi:hypothetical protein
MSNCTVEEPRYWSDRLKGRRLDALPKLEFQPSRFVKFDSSVGEGETGCYIAFCGKS